MINCKNNEVFYKGKFLDRLPLSFFCKQLILGGLLGDGSLQILSNYLNACFFLRHSRIQEQYFFWKVDFLYEIASEKSVQLQKPSGFSLEYKYLFKSRALPALTLIHKYLYAGSKLSIQRRWLNFINPFGLLIWWLDDGSIISHGRKGVLCTDSFSFDSLLVIVRFFRINYNLQISIFSHKRLVKGHERIYYRIYFNTENLKKFLLIIAPFMRPSLRNNKSIDSMLYKFKIVYKNKDLQQRWISELLERIPFYKEAILLMYSNSEKDIVLI
jgi:hypothetical protein